MCKFVGVKRESLLIGMKCAAFGLRGGRVREYGCASGAPVEICSARAQLRRVACTKVAHVGVAQPLEATGAWRRRCGQQSAISFSAKFRILQIRAFFAKSSAPRPRNLSPDLEISATVYP